MICITEYLSPSRKPSGKISELPTTPTQRAQSQNLLILLLKLHKNSDYSEFIPSRSYSK